MSRALRRSIFVLVVLMGGLAMVQCSDPKSDADAGAAGDSGLPVACKADAECDVKAGESCMGGTCVKVACKVNSDCKDAAKACCNVTTYQCAACGGTDGGADAGDIDGAKTCASKDECKPDKWCDNGAGGSGTCLPMGACATDTQCASSMARSSSLMPSR